MKKLVILLLIMFVVYMGVQIGFKFFDQGYTMNYEIKKDESIFQVKEIYSQNKKKEHDNYYFEITVNGTLFNIQTYKRLNRLNKVIKDIAYFKNNNYECIYPISKTEEMFTDVICKNNEYHYYHNIKGRDYEVDNFVNSLKEYGYMDDFNNTMKPLSKTDNVILYDNIPSDIYLGMEYYKGIYSMNQKLGTKKIELFKKDIYNKSISAFVGKYYVVADYDQDYEFHEFYLVNLKTYEFEKIAHNTPISFDSYIQGVVGDSVYIFDKNNKKQYELDTKTKTVIEIGNPNSNIKYYNQGVWEERNAYEASNSNVLFDNYSSGNQFQDITYSRVDKIGNIYSGFYYLYQYQNGEYNVYSANVQNPSIITYLFKTDTIDNIIYKKDRIYYKKGKNLYYYQNLVGEKIILDNSEIQFNKNISFGIY